MNTVLYELHFRWADLLGLLIPLLIGISFWVVSCKISRADGAGKHLFSPHHRDVTGSPVLKWLFRGLAMLCGLVFLLMGVIYLTGYFDMKARYDNGDYLTVEGYVQDLVTTEYPDKGGDSFTVDGVTFAYSNADLTLYGYREEAQSGGVITKEGQYLVIRYLPNSDTGVNHILYIAEREVPPS